MIVLATGAPGAGKTIWVLHQLIDSSLLKRWRGEIPNDDFRVVISGGVRFLDVPDHFQVMDRKAITRWQKYQDGTTFFCDELQEVAPKSKGFPGWMKSLDTHRHRGFTFFFATQDISLIPRELLAFVNVHVHLRAFRSGQSFIWEHQSAQYYNVDKNPDVRSIYTFPSKIFKYYRSATVHRSGVKLPPYIRKLMFYSFMGLCVVFGFVYFLNSIFLNFGTNDLFPDEYSVVSDDKSVSVVPKANAASVSPSSVNKIKKLKEVKPVPNPPHASIFISAVVGTKLYLRLHNYYGLSGDYSLKDFIALYPGSKVVLKGRFLYIDNKLVRMQPLKSGKGL